MLLTNTTGQFDNYLMVSGASMARLLLLLSARHDWAAQYLAADLEARGVAGIPGGRAQGGQRLRNGRPPWRHSARGTAALACCSCRAALSQPRARRARRRSRIPPARRRGRPCPRPPGHHYAEDAGAGYDALLQYATSVLDVFYGGPGGAAAIAGDRQLQVRSSGGAPRWRMQAGGSWCGLGCVGAWPSPPAACSCCPHASCRRPLFAQAFLADLGPGGPGAIRGFPPAQSVTSVARLAEIVAQVGGAAGSGGAAGAGRPSAAPGRGCRGHLPSCPTPPLCALHRRRSRQTAWIAGVQHHALNSNKSASVHAGRLSWACLWLFAGRPRVRRASLKKRCAAARERRPAEPCPRPPCPPPPPPSSLLALPQPGYDGVYPASPGKLFAAPPARKGELNETALVTQILLPRVVPKPDGSTGNGMSYLLRGGWELTRGFSISPRLQPAEQLLHAYTTAWRPPPGCAVAGKLASAAAVLHARLAELSAAIQAREAGLAGTLPRFTLLDPANLPYWSYT